MTHTLCLMTVALVAAQAPQPQLTPTPKQMPIVQDISSAPMIIEQGNAYAYPIHHVRPTPKRTIWVLPRLRRRIGNWFRTTSHQPVTTDCDCDQPSLPVHRPHSTFFRPQPQSHLSGSNIIPAPVHPNHLKIR